MFFKETNSRTLDELRARSQSGSQSATLPRVAPPVLVVEDDDAIRESLTRLLREEGYQVSGARDGIEALARLAHARTRHIIFLDVLIPRMDGIEVCERLAADPTLRRDHTVILMSAWFHHSVASGNMVAARLYKPFDIETVLDLVRRFSATRD